MTSIATRRQLSSAMLAAAVVLAAWIPLLTTYVVGGESWTDLFWQWLDVAELLMLLGAGVLALRRHPGATVFAGLAAGLLVTDAVVDVFLALDVPAELPRAVAMALFAELPLALLCVDLARQSARRWPESRAILALQARQA